MPAGEADPKVMNALFGVIKKLRADRAAIMLALAALLRRVVADIYKLPKKEVEVLVIHRSGAHVEVLMYTDTKTKH